MVKIKLTSVAAPKQTAKIVYPAVIPNITTIENNDNLKMVPAGFFNLCFDLGAAKYPHNKITTEGIDTAKTYFMNPSVPE